MRQSQYGFNLNFVSTWVKYNRQCYSAETEDPPTSNPKTNSSFATHIDETHVNPNENNSKEHRFKNFDELLEKNIGKLVLVDFYAKWCGPCRVARKELDDVRHRIDEMYGEYHNEKDGDSGLMIFSVDTGRFPKLGSRFNITELPAILLFKDGSEVHRFHGLGESTAEKIVPLLKKHL